MAASLPPDGPAFAGRFRLREQLGRGGMGAVFRARDLTLARDVALKLAHGPLEATRLERFRREAQLTAALLHPGIVTVHAAGSEHGRPWIAYELIAGATSLATALRGWPRERRVLAVRDAARALGHAHAHGVVHRDVKPDNLLVDAEGRVRVTDFGVATAADLERLTRSGAIVGTPSYMAPEQTTGAAISPATDVWALGVVLYEALTDRLPFDGDQLFQVLAAIGEGRFPAPRELDPSVPAPLEDVCLRALALDPGARHPDGAAFADALERGLSGERSRRRSPALRAVALTSALAALVVVATVVLATPSPAPAARVAPVPLTPPAVAPTSSSPAVAVVDRAAPEPPPTGARSLDEIPAVEGPVRPLVQRKLEVMLWLDGEGVEDADSGVALSAARELRRDDPAAAARVFKWALRAKTPRRLGQAWHELGRLFQEGLGVERDLRVAHACFEGSAAAGDGMGLTRLAEARLSGHGTAQDTVGAVRAFRQALTASADDPEWVRDSAGAGLAAAALLQPSLVSIDEVEPMLREAAPRRWTALFMLARVRSEVRGDLVEGERLYRECIERNELPEAFVRLARLLEPTDPAGARAALRGPRRREGQLDFAQLLLKDGSDLRGARERAIEVLSDLAGGPDEVAQRARDVLSSLPR